MQRIERYGVIALVFLIVTIVAVSFWGDGAQGAPWERWFASAKQQDGARAAPTKPPRRRPNVSAEQTRRTVGPDLPVSEPQSHVVASPLEPFGGSFAASSAPQAGGPQAGGPEPEPRARRSEAGRAAGTLASHEPEPALAIENPYAAGAAGVAPAPRAGAPRAEPPPPQVAERAAAPSGTRRYVVRQGDSLSVIASRELGSTKRWPEIQALNGGLDPRRLCVGTQILLPPREGPAPSSAATPAPAAPPAEAPKVAAATRAPAGRAYVVRKGDTLSAIASRELGSAGRWREILEANPGLDPERLLVGARLALPAGGPAAAPSERPSPAVARADAREERPSAPRRDGGPRVR